MSPSQDPHIRGRLIFAANGLGNPVDVPARSLSALKSADLLVFEEDRPARQTLKQAGIHREYLKWNEHRSADSLEEIRAALKRGQSVCYMSDQGMPNLADPGDALLQLAYDLKCVVEVIPGPSSITTALAACPFPVQPFFYAGFLPKEEAERLSTLKNFLQLGCAVVILDTPYRVAALIASCIKIYGAQHRAVLAIEMSGEKEEFLYDSLQRLATYVSTWEDKRNFVLVVSGKNR